MNMVCLDVEGVLLPEIWIAVAEHFNVEDLRMTTRDISDYSVLMGRRIEILAEHDIRLSDIQAVIAEMGPLEGAKDFLDWLRARSQVALLSDTFYQFAMPLMAQLDYPMLLCHQLEIDAAGRIVGYNLRQSDSKRHAVIAFKTLNYHVVAAGDSYNDTTMLGEADEGILFNAPDNVISEFPQFPLAKNYEELKRLLADKLRIRSD